MKTMSNANNLKIVVDAMFGRLGNFLRLLGFDTKIADNSLKDRQIMLNAIEEKRMLITRDHPFYRRATEYYEKHELDTPMILYVPYQDLDHQLAVFFNYVDFNSEDVVWKGPDNSAFDSRCAKCNGVLKKVSKKAINDKIPNGTLEQYENFWQCQNENCESIFWVGHAHWDDIIAKIRSAIALKGEVKFTE